jgi:3-deoxy-7-phosphoheptulonate synthase
VIVIMKMGASEQQVQAVSDRIEDLGFKSHVIIGDKLTIIAAIGDQKLPEPETLQVMEGVEKVTYVMKPFKLSSRDSKPEDTVIQLNGTRIGGRQITVMAGPCSVESLEQMMQVAESLKEAGVHILRGGAFKPRTSPYSFQGLGVEGLEILAEVKRRTGLAIITEVMGAEQVPIVAKYADILQIGTRNMQNFNLLNAAGESGKPVLLKRGMMSTVEELLMSAEYILSHRDYQVILCERGIRTFETATRNTLDLSAIPVLKELSHLPVFVDPSHGTGRWQLVPSMAMAAVAAGADGLLIEVHPDPERAISDGAQSLKPQKFVELMRQLRPVAEAVGRTL